ncbi:MAG: hypothetical protein PSN04_10675 [Methyloprofundus sp.]|nr:hypothetical protein [Methyloprofundus sp.]
MSECSFCGVLEKKQFPVCHSCGTLRYPVEKNSSPSINLQQKLKLSATVVAAIITPGAFIALAALELNKRTRKN